MFSVSYRYKLPIKILKEFILHMCMTQLLNSTHIHFFLFASIFLAIVYQAVH